MRHRFIPAMPAVLAIVAAAGTAFAQTPNGGELPMPASIAAAASGRSSALLSPRELDRLLAPVALFPDPLLTDILAASTYPAQIVEAARFVAANASLHDAALTSAAAGQDWDQSVRALLPFPAVLHMLDVDLQRTDRLGQAVSAQQADVLDAVQRLRLAAERAGTLRNGPDANVVNEGQDIVILPPSPQTVYVPAYDTGCVYGPAYDDSQATCDGAADAIDWNDATLLPFEFSQWAGMDWRRRAIRYDRGGTNAHDHDGDADGGVWHHGAPRHEHPAGAGTAGGHFNYAPPADALMHARFVARAQARGQFRTPAGPGPALHHAGGFHPPSAPAIHAASVAHGGVMADGNGHR